VHPFKGRGRGSFVFKNSHDHNPWEYPVQVGRGGQAQRPRVVSPKVSSDRHITFRVYAPRAQSVRLTASDIPRLNRGLHER
jgi:hypothetical protein